MGTNGVPLIQLQDVHKKLGGREILRGVTLDVRDGETLVVIGRSGTGKSVTLKTLIGLLHPDKGRIIIQGRDVTGLPEREYAEVRRLFGVLFQSGALINWLSVAENVALPLREHTTKSEEEIQAIVADKLKLLELTHARDLMPSEISGGMKKRAGLARALVLGPKVILYDEPTSGLDPVMSSQINELVNRMKREVGVTSILVTHDMESAYSVGDRIAMLYEGRIIFIGSPDEAKNTEDEVVHQFVRGLLEGPITDALRKEEGLGAQPRESEDGPGDEFGSDETPRPKTRRTDTIPIKRRPKLWAVFRCANPGCQKPAREGPFATPPTCCEKPMVEI